MTVVTTRPNATDDAATSVTGAATTHAALSDDSDASYADLSTIWYGDTMVVQLAEPSIPAGAAVKQYVLRIRDCVVGGSSTSTAVELRNGSTVLGTSNSTTTWSTASTVTYITYATGSAVADLRVSVTSGPLATLRNFELYVDTTYVAKPTTTVTAPTGSLTTTSLPTVTWTNTLDSDGGAQTSAQVKIFSAAQYGAGGFDPSTSPATYSGIVSGSATTKATDVALVDGSYRAYVRVAQTVNYSSHWSDWDYEAFSVLLDRPGDPTVNVTGETSYGRVRIDLDDTPGDAGTDIFEIQASRDGGTTWGAMRLLSGDALVAAGSRRNLIANPSFETNTTGWSTSSPAYHMNSGATLTRQTPVIAQQGSYVGQIVTPGAVAAEGMAFAFSGYTFKGGTPYTLSMSIMASASTDCDLMLGKASADCAKADPTVTTTWTRYSVTWTPASDDTTVYAVLRTNLGGSPQARTIQVDGVMVEQASSAGTYIEGVEGATVYDYEARNGTAETYRVRALHDFGGGSYSASAWVQDSGTYTSPYWWVKHPSLPALNLPVTVYSQEGYSREARQGIFQALGSTRAVVVDDEAGPKTGSITFRFDTDAEQDAFDELFTAGVSLLIQAPSGHHWPDRWVRLAGQDRRRIVDKSWGEATLDTYTWTEVGRPTVDVLAWSA